MKKLILMCAVLIGGAALYSPIVNAAQVTTTASEEAYELPGDAKTLTVYKVVQVGGNTWSESPSLAYYSRSVNCIYVTEGRRVNQPYAVTENRAYGQQNDGRAEYRYTAGGYYFNLK